MLSFILTDDGGCRQDVGDRVGDFQGPTEYCVFSLIMFG